MSNDKKTLADVKPGGRVRLTDQAERARFEEWAGKFWSLEKGWWVGQMRYHSDYAQRTWEAWQAALSAQPSPGGQGDARALIQRYDAAGAKFRESLMDDHYSDAQRVELRRELTAVQDELLTALAARQPVGEAVGYIEHFSDKVSRMEMTVPGLHLGLGRHPVYANPPAQAVDLPYSLDADPAGIRARVADVITGTLMVGAQGHTPPPAGHWAEPFWKAARADATAQAVDLGAVRQLAEKWMRIGGEDARFCAGELLALIDSVVVGK